MTPAVLVTRHIHAEAVGLLRERFEVDFHDSEDGLSPAELQRRAAGKAGLVSQLTDRIDAALLEAAGDALRVVANVAVGFDNVDLDAARARGIVVTNTPGVLTGTTADLAWALLMAAARRIPEAERFLRAGRWEEWRVDLLCGRDVHHAVLGLVGLGRIGRAVARRARGFDMTVLYADPHPLPEADERALGIERVAFDELLERSDFVSLHVPLNESTHHLIGAAELARMKPASILVNTTRGPVVDEAALAAALANGSIAAAGLDVFEHEPDVHPGLLALDNVVLVPHIGSASVETRRRMCLMAARNCTAVLAGEPPPNPVP